MELNQSQESKHPLRHLAIIMDGNNRWASVNGLDSLEGHTAGVERIRDILRASKKQGIEIVSLFAFSSENWFRPNHEVSGLMTLFSHYLKKEAPLLREDGVRLTVVGNRSNFDSKLCELITEAEKITLNGALRLILCVDYGGRWDITEAARLVANQVNEGHLRVEDITESTIANNLQMKEIADPDLCIRTGGEERISNFLLWQLAYTEFLVSDQYWPDFGESELEKAIEEYYSRKRRFGRRKVKKIAEGVAESIYVET
ncbi:MAG: di-trans,poly-cis-decaprenylcistransferase [Cellvibrionales bacterium TMED49]|nr:MAG: di-trans,poly-cis-decaprenylcistransferase [Cellvibrionales bacterium TMED49]